MAKRMHFKNNTEIGCYAMLTNSYCLVALDESNVFSSAFEEDLREHMPVCRTSIANLQIIGTMTVGNRKGLLVPMSTTDQELQHIRNTLPDEVKVRRVDERLSALGNVIVCNDHVALVHPDISKDTVDIIVDVLDVEVFRQTVHTEPLVGTYCVLTNRGAIVHPMTPSADQNELSNLLQVPLVAGTINQGSAVLGAGLIANDFCAYVGKDSTATEIRVIEQVFKIDDDDDDDMQVSTRDALVETLA